MKQGYMFMLTVLSISFMMWVIKFTVAVDPRGTSSFLAGLIMFCGLLPANMVGWGEVE